LFPELLVAALLFPATLSGRCGIYAAVNAAMALPSIKPQKILIPDVPPLNDRESEAGLVIAGIGILCASVVFAAMLFVFLGA